MPPMPVEVADVTVGRIEEKFQAVGTIEADEAVTVVAEIEGTVTGIPYREGEKLGKGRPDRDSRRQPGWAPRCRARRRSSHRASRRMSASSRWWTRAAERRRTSTTPGGAEGGRIEPGTARARHAKTRISARLDGTAGSAGERRHVRSPRAGDYRHGEPRQDQGDFFSARADDPADQEGCRARFRRRPSRIVASGSIIVIEPRSIRSPGVRGWWRRSRTPTGSSFRDVGRRLHAC